jgi:hypothetical protein
MRRSIGATLALATIPALAILTPSTTTAQELSPLSPPESHTLVLEYRIIGGLYTNPKDGEDEVHWNVLAGWTLMGWIVALVWYFRGNDKAENRFYEAKRCLKFSMQARNFEAVSFPRGKIGVRLKG